jgi:hypothetical protein
MQMNYSMKNLQTLIAIFLLANVGFVHAEPPLDFDGDGKTDFAVIRQRPPTVVNCPLDWYIARSSNNVLIHREWGIGCTSTGFDDLPEPDDYDGDGKTDVAVARVSDQPGMTRIYILNSADATVRVEQFGQQFDDFRAIGDYDGDDKADLAVYRGTSTGLPNFFIYRGSLNNPNGSLTYVNWGTGFNVTPYYGDFDGDGKDDFCVRLAGLGRFALLRSSDLAVEWINWGLPNDNLFSGDYDGDGRTDFGLMRVVGGAFHWYILERDGGGTGAAPIIWGRNNVSPFDGIYGNGDYDGDGRTDIGVYRRTENPNTFFIRKSIDGSMLAYQLGASGDQPVPIW